MGINSKPLAYINKPTLMYPIVAVPYESPNPSKMKDSYSMLLQTHNNYIQ